jgi:hypothetical protein
MTVGPPVSPLKIKNKEEKIFLCGLQYFSTNLNTSFSQKYLI